MNTNLTPRPTALQRFRSLDSKPKALIVTGIAATVFALGYAGIQLKRHSSKPVPRTARTSLVANDRSEPAIGTNGPSRWFGSTEFLQRTQGDGQHRRTDKTPPPRPVTIPSITPPPRRRTPPPKGRKPVLRPPAAVDVPLKAGDVFKGTAGREALGYVRLVVLDVDKVRRTLLVNVRLRDYPLWGVFHGVVTRTGSLVFKQVFASGRSPTPPPGSQLVVDGAGYMKLSFEDEDKLIGYAGGVRIDLTREPNVSQESRKTLLKAPIASLEWKKFAGNTVYQVNPRLAGFGSAQARPNLPIELHIGTVNEELKQVLAILSVKGHPSWKAYLRGTVLEDGITVRFVQVRGVVDMSGYVGEFIRQARNAPVEVMLVPDGRLVGHRGPYFFSLKPLPGVHKRTIPSGRNSKRRRP